MKIKDYLLTEEIITDEIRNTYAPYITTDGQDVINSVFKYEYGNKELITPDKADIEAMTKMTLLKNHLEYTKIKEMLDNSIKLNYSEHVIHSPAETTQTHTPAEILTETTLPDYTKTIKPAEETTITTPSKTTQERTLPGETITETGTQSDVNITLTKPFDNIDFVETEKTDNTSTPNLTNKKVYDNKELTETTLTDATVKSTVDNPNTEIMKYDGKQIVDTTTLKDDVVKIEVNKEEQTTINKPSEEIDNYLKYIEIYKINLYIKIVDDLLNVLCLQTWDNSWYDL